jgi:hypothetical protein
LSTDNSRTLENHYPVDSAIWHKKVVEVITTVSAKVDQSKPRVESTTTLYVSKHTQEPYLQFFWKTIRILASRNNHNGLQIYLTTK